MKISIVSMGKFENTCHKEVYLNYAKRINWKVELKELEFKNTKNLSSEEIKKNEANLLLNNIRPQSYLIAMDEKGKQFSSFEFAEMIKKFAVNGESDLTFVLGGAEGLADEILLKSRLKISLGKMTLPHLMARSMLIEQIYRAQTIISGHPYHR